MQQGAARARTGADETVTPTRADKWLLLEWDGCMINVHAGDWMFYMDWRCWRFGRKIVRTLGGLRMFRRWQLGPLQVWHWFPIPWTKD